jgi:hypothetical protein
MEQIGLLCKEIIKNKNMKQLLSLFLFLLPCLAWAQYPSNGNQKITLGEQTTADGLIYRGVAATDTVRKPSIDTMAYMVLDTTTNIMWHYKKATSDAWLRLNLLPSDTASMLTNYWRSGRFSGVLPVANGGTNATTLTANKLMVGNGTSGVLTPTNLHWDNTNSRLGIGNSSPNSKLNVDGNIIFKDNLQGQISASGAQIIFSQTANNPFWMNMFNNNNTGRFICGVEGSAGATFTGSSANSAFFGSNAGDLHIISDGTIRQTIKSTGTIAIGTVTPQSGYRLTVIDSVYVGGNVSASAYTTRSDYNLKDDIFNIKYGLNDILQLQPVEYTYKSNGSKQLGFIAQDIGTILPEVVSFEESMSVNYQAIIPILTKAIQEQQALIKALEQRIINLENK